MSAPRRSRWIRRGAAAFMAAMGHAAPLFAQGDAGGGSVAPPSRSHMWDIVIFVLLVGAALFVVCRSSRRS